MQIARTVARWICTLAFAVVGVAALQGVAIVAFILTGTLVPGEQMFGGGATPSLTGAAAFSVLGLAGCALLAIVRHKLSAGRVEPVGKGTHVGA